MKKEQVIIEMLLQRKSPEEILSALSQKDKAILQMLKEGKTYKEIENSLQVFPANIAFIKRYLFKELPDSNTNSTLDSDAIETPESEVANLLNSATTTTKEELKAPPETKEEITKQPSPTNVPEVENTPPLKEQEKQKFQGVMRRRLFK